MANAFGRISDDIEALASSNYVVGVCTPVSLGMPTLTIRIQMGGAMVEQTIPYSVEQLDGNLRECDPILVSGDYERVCVADTTTCVDNQVVVCDEWGANAQRTDCSALPGVCLNAQCVPTICGDTRVDPTEECDDGNQNNTDDCSNDCRIIECFIDADCADYTFSCQNQRCIVRCDLNEDSDGDGVNACDDCDDNDRNNYPGKPERCDGQDNDCDERTDEGFNLGDACVSGEGDCRQSGTTICAANGVDATCDAAPNLDNIRDETCDDRDNDCDGRTDEGFDVGGPCTVGIGVCANDGGTKQCAASGLDTECVGRPLPSGAELCNGLDDDCDGLIDEDIPEDGADCPVFGNTVYLPHWCSHVSGRWSLTLRDSV